MIIGAHLEHAAPDHPAGAEWTLHDTFAWLARRQHDCRIVANRGHTQARIDDVLIYTQPSEAELDQHYAECDVMLTQLDATMHAQLLAASHQTPLIQYVHSASQLEQLGVMPTCSALVIFNTQHVADASAWWPGPSLVLRPPINAERVRVDKPGACTTLVNLSNPKGGLAFWRLAHSLTTLPFLGVQGAYDHQVLAPTGLATYNENDAASGLPANLRVMGAVRDIRDALGYTRLLLVLSWSETYGRIAGEAAVSGIPSICADTPGLRECLGDAGRYVDLAKGHSALERAVRAGYTQEWDAWSRQASLQAAANAKRQDRELRVLERALMRINRENPEMRL